MLCTILSRANKLFRGEKSIRIRVGTLGNVAFLVGELLIELRVLKCLKVNEVTLMVNEVTPTERYIESRTV